MLLHLVVDQAAVEDLQEELKEGEVVVEEEEGEEEEESGTLIVQVDWLLPEILAEPELFILLEEIVVRVDDLTLDKV